MPSTGASGCCVPVTGLICRVDGMGGVGVTTAVAEMTCVSVMTEVDVMAGVAEA